MSFAQAWKSRVEATFDVAPLYVIGRAMLIKNKRAAGRDKDLADVALLALHRGLTGKQTRRAPRKKRR